MAVLERIVKNVGHCNAGRFGAGDIRASRFVIEASHHVADAVWSPRLGLVLDVASGDKNPADPNLQTFNALFQSGTYSGRAQLLGPSNSIRLEPSVMLAPARHVLVSAGRGFYADAPSIGARQLHLRLQRTVRGAVGPCHSDDELRVALGDLSVLTGGCGASIEVT